MLPSVTRSSLHVKLLCELVTNASCKCNTRQIVTSKYPTIFRGYSKVRQNKQSNESNYFYCHRLTSSFSTSSSNTNFVPEELTAVQFEKISDETLDSLTEYFDEIIEEATHLTDADVAYGDGVLTVKFGNSYGTYVINRQTPNKQIWLSSPKSGPKRYDYTGGQWIYKHDGKTLHELLNSEIPAIVKDNTSFEKCSYSGTRKGST